MSVGFRAVVVTLALAGAAPLHAEEWEARPPNGRIVTHVFAAGLLKAFAHDHHFEATSWRATARLPKGDAAGAEISLVVDADSLRDRQPSLSEDERRKVNRQVAGPEVLDAERHPSIEFRSERVEVASDGDPDHVRGTVHGTLTVRGRSAAVDVAFDAERLPNEWRVRGSTRFSQTAFGIEPFSGFAGTVSVKDEVEVELALILHAAR